MSGSDWEYLCGEREKSLIAAHQRIAELVGEARRSRNEAEGLQDELKKLLVLILEARLEHACADHSHERRWGCPECKLVAHLDASGWTDVEAVRDA
jgi:hypothetical protein